MAVSAVVVPHSAPSPLVVPDVADPDALARVPRSKAIAYNVLPLVIRRSGMDETLVLGCPDPERRRHRHTDSTGAEVGLSVKTDAFGLDVVCPDDELHRMHVELRAASRCDFIEFVQVPSSEVRERTQRWYGTQRVASSQPVVEFVETMYEDAILRHAHDISIEPLNPNRGPAGRIRFHILGRGRVYKLVDTEKEYLAIVATIKSRATGMDQTKRRVRQDGREIVRMPHCDVALRLVSTPTRRTEPETITIRLLRLHVSAPTPAQLGMRAGTAERFERALGIRGLLTVGGDPGAGKSTTAHAGISLRNDDATKVVALEDPTEIPIYGVLQAEVDELGGLSAQDIRSSFTRHAVDFGSAGEMRDPASAENAMDLAGIRPMLGTIHSDGALGIITELVYRLKVERHVVERRAHTLVGQHLVRRLCRECRRPAPIPDELRLLRASARGGTYEPVGCDFCDGGYIRRFGVFEIVEVSVRMRRAIADGESQVELEQIAADEGFVPMLEDAIDRVLEGETTIAELRGVPGYDARMRAARLAGRVAA